LFKVRRGGARSLKPKALGEGAGGEANLPGASPSQLFQFERSDDESDEFELRQAVLESAAEAETLPFYSSFSDAIEDWQLLLLEEAYDSSSSNRKKISISALAKECQLSRSQVLDWLKSRSTLREDQVDTIRAVCLAAVEREESLEDTTKKKEAKRAYSKLSVGERRKVQASATKDKMSALALKTLLKFWGRNRNPSRQHINEMARMTKLSPTIVNNWFKKKRDESPSRSTNAKRRRRRIK
jgi:transcriptional regulator with XRE-family HTH domain